MTIQGDFLEIRGFLVFEDDLLSLAYPDSKLEWKNKIKFARRLNWDWFSFFWLYFVNDL